MPLEQDEELLLRSVALQNAKSILQVRRNAEEELIRAKETLERRTAELAASLALTHATLESTADGILVTDNAGNVTGFNQKYLDIWDLTEATIAQPHARLLEICGLQFEDPQRFAANVEDIRMRAPPETFDVLELRDGRVFERASRTQSVHGRIVGRVWSFRDVTETRRAERERERLLREVRETGERHRLALEAGQIGVWEWDIVSGRMNWSDRIAAMLGMQPGEFDATPKTFPRYIHAEDVERVIAAIRASLEHDVPYRIEYRILPKGAAPRWIYVTGSVIRDALGSPVRMIGATTDITERKRAEEELKEADRKKDDFLALLAHELRNPLAPLRNGLQVIRLAGGDAAAVAKARAMMDRQLGHMIRLIDDLLDISRIGRNKMQLRRTRVLLADIIENAVETAGPALEAAGIEFRCTLPPGPVFLDADLTRLAQVFSNLLNNCAKYTEHGGRVWLAAERRGDEVSISVRDTGIGIPAEALVRIFDMFSQVDRPPERASGGLGIGLALVKGIIEMHGGSVSAESAGPGKGSTFTVRLPVQRARAHPSPPASAQEAEHAVRGERRRILVADDNADSAVTLADVLGLLGYEVRTVCDGAAAVAEMRTFEPEVILMDVGMPGMNGYEATRCIRALQAATQPVIIAVTGWGQENDRLRSRQAGCDGHLVKPVDLASLEKLMDDLLRGRAKA